MGGVYRARDTKLDRDVAIKVLPVPDLDWSPRVRLQRRSRGHGHAHPGADRHRAGRRELPVTWGQTPRRGGDARRRSAMGN